MATDDLNLSDLTAQAIRAQKRHIEALVASREPTAPSYDPDHIAKPEQIDSAQRALTGLIKEARSLVKDATRWAAQLSIEEKRAAIADWFSSLPAQQRRLLLEELARIDAA